MIVPQEVDTWIEQPLVLDSIDAKSLHFAGQDLQSRMSKADPFALLLDYTKTMMAFLLFVPRPQRIALVGLGGGSLAKFCHRELPHTIIDVVEINRHVVALRDEFRIPPDDTRFRIHLDDGARFIAQTTHHYDAILLDGYTQDGIPAALASHKFYRDCRQALAPDGVMVSNLHGPEVESHLAKIRRAFRDQVICFDEATCTNKTVLASNCADASVLKPEHPDAALLESGALRTLLPSLLLRCASLSWPTRRRVARL